jgi:cobyrinic acid a,c-diamide synthase
MPRCPILVIAGTHSGSGKTSLALALTHALTRRGLAVQTFKVGPDFLDPTYLALASGRPCYNLDGWMAGREHVCRLFERAVADADIALVEGVMGLFDGADTAGPEGSTAEIARWLDAPILLVANVHGMARSLAALVRGFATFEPGLRIRGVVANHCGSERHAEWLADALRAADLPPLVGAIPRGAFPQLASRHLGLVTADERHLPEVVLDTLANALEQHLSLETLFPGWVKEKAIPSSPAAGKAGVPGFPARLRIGAARDAAFHFYYRDLFDTLAAAGCETVFFSPLSDRRLPEGISGLYLGGGYPEAHAEALAANGEILAAIREYAASGKPLYAECGGLMYLSRGLLEAGGRFHPFLGILPARTRMLDGKKALGYVEITLTADSLWGRCGDVFRGHEFHYSELIDDPVADPAWRTVYTLRRRRSEAAEAEGFQKEAILASYTHLYYASLPAAIDHFIARCGGTP